MGRGRERRMKVHRGNCEKSSSRQRQSQLLLEKSEGRGARKEFGSTHGFVRRCLSMQHTFRSAEKFWGRVQKCSDS